MSINMKFNTMIVAACLILRLIIKLDVSHKTVQFHLIPVEIKAKKFLGMKMLKYSLWLLKRNEAMHRTPHSELYILSNIITLASMHYYIEIFHNPSNLK